MTESTLLQTTENNNTTTTKMDRAVSPSPSEQQYALKWNDFQSSILSSFRHLRDEEDFVDVTLACDIRSFTAHKVVLSACSPYFRKLLKANPCEHPIVILRDIRAEDVESLLRFMYNGEVHIGHEQLSDFLKTAQLLQVRGLADVTGPQSKGLPVSTSLTPEMNTSSTAAEVSAIRSGMMGSSMSNQLGNVNATKLQETKASPKKHPDLASLQAQSTGEDSNSSDHSAASDAGDYDDTMNGSMDQRFSNFLGLQGIPGLLPGPSGMHNDSFDDVQSQQRDCNATSTVDGVVKQEVNIDDDDRYTPSSMGSHSSSNVSKKNHQSNVNFTKTNHNDAVSYRDQQRQNLLSASILLSRSRHATANELNEMLQSSVPSGYLLPCPLCEAPLEPRLFRQHLDRHYPRDSPVCPVLQCGRRFAHPNSVRNHMRIKHTMQWAKMKAMRSSGGPFSGVTDFK